MILHSIQTYIEQHQLLRSGQPVIVGLSGGADSVALLDILIRIGYKCIAAHCNFHLRGDESYRDEQFAAAFAAEQGVLFIKTDFATEQYAAEKHISIEMAARELRYTWFEQLRQEYNAQAIAVAHHRDDSAETLLLNLIRGTGIRGITGIRAGNGYIVRPLLAISRDDIVHYLQERNQPYVTDSTNLSDAYTRNFIRLNVLPLLAEINPSVKNSIARTAEHLSDAETIFLQAIANAEKDLWQQNKLSIKHLLTYAAPRTILYELLRVYGFTRQVTDDMFLSLNKTSGKQFFSATHHVIKDRNFLLLQPNKTEEAFVYTIAEETEQIMSPITLSFRKEISDAAFQPEKDSCVAYFDYDKLTFPLTLRKWKTGDWFIPFGMKGRKKLSDYFTNRKFSLADKAACWLLCSGEQILWVVGERSDNRYRIDNTTKIRYVIKFFDKIN